MPLETRQERSELKVNARFPTLRGPDTSPLSERGRLKKNGCGIVPVTCVSLFDA